MVLDDPGESGNPSALADGDTSMIGKQKILKVTFSDEGQGLRHTEIVITQDNRPRVLSTIDYPEAGVRRKEISVAVDASVLKLNDGPASLILTAVDYSLWKNRTVITLPVQIDFMPPQIFQLNPTHHINQGGVCVVTYRLSEAVSQTGVQVGDLFYPGHPIDSFRKTRLRHLLRLAAGCDAGRPADPHPGSRSGGKRNRQRHPRPDQEAEIPQRHDGPYRRLFR